MRAGRIIEARCARDEHGCGSTIVVRRPIRAGVPKSLRAMDRNRIDAV